MNPDCTSEKKAETIRQVRILLLACARVSGGYLTAEYLQRLLKDLEQEVRRG